MTSSPSPICKVFMTHTADELLLHRKEGSFHGREQMAEEVARALLRAGYGIDFAWWRTMGPSPMAPPSDPIRPPVEVLEAMVSLAAAEPEFDWVVSQDDDDAEEQAYYVLSAEIGDWRDEA